MLSSSYIKLSCCTFHLCRHPESLWSKIRILRTLISRIYTEHWT